MATSFSAYARQQYTYLLESRKTLLGFCGSFSPVDLHKQNTTFGNGGTVASQLVHVINTYEAWIGKRALQKPIQFSNVTESTTLEDIRGMFDVADEMVTVFIQTIQTGNELIRYERNGKQQADSALKFFTHVVTHEYHHKGQILSLARSLGYTPVDTDVLR